MARKRNTGSDIPYGGLGLNSEEEKTLIKLLKNKDTSLAKLKRYLIREWIKQQTDPESGILRLNKI